MTTRALTPGPATRRRALFGLLDADGWAWASVKATIWFILILFILGYVPDRAYYFTVNRTVDLGILAWTPVNLCPPENNQSTLPCPAPVGALLPWEPSPADGSLNLPAGRTDGALVQSGTKLLYIGGSDGTAASDSVFVAENAPLGNFQPWTEGPPLPEPRSDAAVAVLNGVIYVSGGAGADGAPTTTTFILRPNLQTGELGEWTMGADEEVPIDLPEARTGASTVALGDGLLLVGGVGPDGAPNPLVWKSELDRQGALGAWTAQAPLGEGITDATAVINGDFVWVYGGRTAAGPTATVWRGTVETAEGDTLGDLIRWGTSPGSNLPVARANAGGWAVNGSLYLAGGVDASGTRPEVYWGVPVAGADGDVIPEWKHLPVSDLPAPGLAGAGMATSGSSVFLVGGRSGDAVQQGAVRSNLSPQEPFFQLGLVGAVVPGLQIPGEIGQQLGQLNAAGIGTVNFIILIVLGWAIAHRERTMAFLRRFRKRGAARRG